MARALTDSERGCLNTLRTFEAAVREGKLTVTVYASPGAMAVIQTCEDARIFRTLGKAKWSEAQKGFQIQFLLTEYRKYIAFVCHTAKVTVNIDGSLGTPDGLTIAASNYVID